jgi:hypothetical protein
MRATSTQIASYRQCLDEGLGEKQLAVFKELQRGPRSGRALAKALKWPVNRMWPRLNELRDMGLVVEAYKDLDTQTDRQVIIWQVVSGPFTLFEQDVDAEQQHDGSWHGSVGNRKKQYETLEGAIKAAQGSSSDYAGVLDSQGRHLWPLMNSCKDCGTRLWKGESCWKCEDAEQASHNPDGTPRLKDVPVVAEAKESMQIIAKGGR